MDQKHRGAFSEGVAISALLERGFDVFRNFSNYGPADLVAINWETGEVYLIDVKTARDGPNGNEFRRTLTPEQVAAGVNLIQVTRDGKFLWADKVAISTKTSYKVSDENEPEQRESPRPDLRRKPLFKVYEGAGGGVSRGGKVDRNPA